MPWKNNNIPHLWCQWCLFSTVIWSILLTKVHCFVTAGALTRLVNMKPLPSHSDSSGRIRPHRLLLNNVSGVSRRRYAWMFGGRKGGCKARQGRGLLSWCQVHVWRRPARGEVSTPTTPFWSKFTSIAASFTGSTSGKKVTDQGVGC